MTKEVIEKELLEIMSNNYPIKVVDDMTDPDDKNVLCLEICDVDILESDVKNLLSEYDVKVLKYGNIVVIKYKL